MNEFVKYAVKKIDNITYEHVLLMSCTIFLPWRIQLKVVYKSASLGGFRECCIELDEKFGKGGNLSEGAILYVNKKYEYDTIMRLTKAKNDTSDTTKLSRKKKKIILKYGEFIFDDKLKYHKIHNKMVFGYFKENFRIIDEL